MSRDDGDNPWSALAAWASDAQKLREYDRMIQRVLKAGAPAELFEPRELPPPRRPHRRKLPPVPNSLLTANVAAARLGTTVDQVLAFVRDGELRYINIGRGAKRPRYRFTEVDINELIESRKERGAQCLSTSRKNQHRTSGTTSNCVASGFMARRAAQLAAKRKR